MNEHDFRYSRPMDEDKEKTIYIMDSFTSLMQEANLMLWEDQVKNFDHKKKTVEVN